MRVAVIGYGAFGSWLTEQYISLNFQVKIYDRDLEKVEKAVKNNIVKCKSLEDAVADIDVVIVAVPIHEAPRTILNISEKMREGFIVDISSLKKTVYTCLLNLPSRLKPVCLHPLFGPSSKSFTGEKVAIIPVRDYLEELDIAMKLMPGAEFIKMSMEEHDEAMTYILSLTHILSLTISSVLGESSRKELLKLSGTSFRYLINMIEATMNESAETFTSIIFYNEGSAKLYEEIIEKLEEAENLLKEGDFNKLCRFVKEIRETYLKWKSEAHSQ
ncbi:MAG: prephenate dehydrogenase [Nitrososphaerota archaeon]